MRKRWGGTPNTWCLRQGLTTVGFEPGTFCLKVRHHTDTPHPQAFKKPAKIGTISGKPPLFSHRQGKRSLLTSVGFEPGTFGLKARRLTNSPYPQVFKKTAKIGTISAKPTFFNAHRDRSVTERDRSKKRVNSLECIIFLSDRGGRPAGRAYCHGEMPNLGVQNGLLLSYSGTQKRGAP